MAETSVARITDISAKSTKSIEDAIHVGIARAQKTMYSRAEKNCSIVPVRAIAHGRLFQPLPASAQLCIALSRQECSEQDT